MQQAINQMRAGDIRQGRNPRTYFDPVEMAEMEASVAEKGVIQPILIRPVEDWYEIVAGERRWRAAMKTRGEDYGLCNIFSVKVSRRVHWAGWIKGSYSSRFFRSTIPRRTRRAAPKRGAGKKADWGRSKPRGFCV